MNFIMNNRLAKLRICKLRAYFEKLIGRWLVSQGGLGELGGQGGLGDFGRLGKLKKMGKKG